jgi:hypothetical protein
VPRVPARSSASARSTPTVSAPRCRIRAVTCAERPLTCFWRTTEAWLYLEALALDTPANITLVSRFDDLASAYTEPSIDQLVAATGRPLVRTFEIHHWVRVGGAWRREAATRHFIGR